MLMPTTTTCELPRPKSWEEFEDICLSISKNKWKNTNFSRFGRPGQNQDGIDIIGYIESDYLIGIQCKNTLVNKITIDTINKEILKAENFNPPINELHIATSSVRDGNIQTRVAKLSQERAMQGKFRVFIIFWPDIEQELSKDPKELMRFYPQFFQDFSQPKSGLTSTLRERDVNCLNNLLNHIDLDAFHEYLEWGPKYIKFNFIEHYSIVENIIHKPLFLFNDRELHQSLAQWINKWTEMVNKIYEAPYNYDVNRDELTFTMPFDSCRTPEENKIYEDLRELRFNFIDLLNNFCIFIHENYPEIDLSTTSFNARNFFRKLST